MQFVAKVKFIPFSPYKLRPLVDVVRGKSTKEAIAWLSTYAVKRARPIRKMIESAAANAKNKDGVDIADLWVKEIRVDEGRTTKYSKPGGMGRAAIQRRRSSHMSVVLEQKNTREKA